MFTVVESVTNRSGNRNPAGAGKLVQALHAKPIVITSTGRAAIEVSRSRPESDILVFSHSEAVLRQMALGWGLFPVGVVPPEQDIAKLINLIITESLSRGLITESDVVTIVHGFLTGVSGTTNTIQVLDMKEYLNSAPPVAVTVGDP